jgi:hypothetical protein
MSAFEADRFNHSRTSPGKTIFDTTNSVTEKTSAPEFTSYVTKRRIAFSRLPAIAKEILQHLSRASRQYSRSNFHSMI